MIAWFTAVALAGEPEWAPVPERVWVETEDGAWLAAHRTPRPGAPPVVLCHGISSNHHFWDLAPGRSLAEHLWSQGYDVWNLDLRGHGDALRDPEGRRQRPGWTVDDYGTKDLPAAFAHVLQATGAPALHYVGHSMGGMVLAVYLAHTPDPPLASAVVVGSPLDFRDPDALVKLLLDASPAMGPLGSLPTPAGAKLLAVLGRNAPLQLDALIHNPENVSRRAERLMLRRVASPITRGEAAQLGQARRDGEFRPVDGGPPYRERLGHVRVPMLFIAGRADRVVSADRVRVYHDAVGSPDKAWLIASRANGMHGDYGHLDLGAGDHAAVDVFPRIAAWLDAHLAPPDRGGEEVP